LAAFRLLYLALHDCVRDFENPAECVVADAVGIEAVSASNSLLEAGKQGILAKLARFADFGRRCRNKINALEHNSLRY
jgi:hypothetical protein